VATLTIVVFRSFGVIFVLTQGGPVQRTNTLVWEVYLNAFSYLRFNRAAALSAALHECLETMTEARVTPEDFLTADFQFHQLVAEAAHNRILLRGMLAMRGPLRRLMAERAQDEVAAHGNLDVAIEDHLTLVEAMKQRDVDGAIAALNGMIERNREHLKATEQRD